MAGEFNAPRVRLNRISTRAGDGGDTSLVGGQRVSKASQRIVCAGAVDELNAFTGLARLTCEDLPPLAAVLLRVQHELFNLGSEIATLSQDVAEGQARVTSADVERLDTEIESFNEGLESLKSFVLPGSAPADAYLHLCRTVCRRAERECVRLSAEEDLNPEVIQYLNRLSDAFFVWGRWTNQRQGIAETLWDPNRQTL